ncbi:hypothetical protein CVT24_005787 [Panaeolus cyanescens]|uniref:Uncharacterized protein n=1 Tax=Panaeolus cyanescens TaxID=181874 RepID=A0A409VEA0_9AGAR|nr:hypothetical protein CVT24_005787 [Panaeolus cyanescens]
MEPHSLLFSRRKTHPNFVRQTEDCIPSDPANTVTQRLNDLLQNSGDGFILNLCPRQTYLLQAPILFAHPNQEIRTLGIPLGDDRATLAVVGPVANGEGHTTAIDATCDTCSGVRVRNIQVDGTRRGASPTKGGGNIIMGGNNADQLVENVRSYDPRSWTTLHVSEGSLSCRNVTLQNNELGPCGSDAFQEWADGISLSCRDSVVRNNLIQGATDGGIVVFGAPGSQIYNNTIWILNQTLLGGINMVDYDPWGGDYTGTVVRDNLILGGFATDEPDSSHKGNNFKNAIIKIGIAIGPRTWFGDRFGDNVVRNGVVQGNMFSGAFTYGIAATSAEGFQVRDNSLVGNTSFIGARGPHCKDTDVVPDPAPFIMDPSSLRSTSFQSDFQAIHDGDSLTCVLPPNGGDFWPFGTNPSNTSSPYSPQNPGGSTTSTPDSSKAHSSTGIVVGVLVGIFFAGVAGWCVRKYIVARNERTRLYNSTKQNYTPSN